MSPTSRRHLSQIAVISLLAGFIVAALFGPPDPFSQLLLAGGVLVIGLGAGYLVIHETDIEVPELSWGDLFRGIVTTFLFWILIWLLISLVTSVDERSVAPVFQFVVLVISAVTAGIVISFERIPWPGDD